MDQKSIVKQQFSQQASAYLTSTVHAQGEDLTRLGELLKNTQPQRVLDLGCGAGHVSFLAARYASEVIAYDMSEAMLSIVNEQAKQKGWAHLKTQQGVVENLPFDDHCFDMVVTRFSAHHWSDVRQALSEAYRVLAPHGKLVVIDIVAAEQALFDTYLQTVEFLRDPSHIRDYRLSEWVFMLDKTGFIPQGVTQWELPMVFADWVKRSATSAERVSMLQTIWQEAPSDVKAFFSVQADGSFNLRSAYIECCKHD